MDRLQVIARICLDKSQFTRVLNALVFLFQDDKLLLETRGALIIRKLCALLDAKSIYVSFASILDDRVDLDFASVMVQTMNLILLTAPELVLLRKCLKDSFNIAGKEADSETFIILFRSWCHNPVATFSLCLLAQAYDLSSSLIMCFAEIDVSVGFLMQIDKLVQLLESPIFIHLRLELLEVKSSRHEDLLKSLYGLLMLLPQSQAYKTLSDRLSTISSLQIHMSGSVSRTVIEKDRLRDSRKSLYDELLKRFDSIQERHSSFRLSNVFNKTS
jgi:vacuole morphology and inheritance protein 14